MGNAHAATWGWGSSTPTPAETAQAGRPMSFLTVKFCVI